MSCSCISVEKELHRRNAGNRCPHSKAGGFLAPPPADAAPALATDMGAGASHAGSAGRSGPMQEPCSSPLGIAGWTAEARIN